ncbi:MAG: AraC family transcriptional regulator [Verrucomicrobia bacterium]|nr:MAG: AraC family transcriptional regulator [Verrucomicrobiota bacterium]TAE89139.1 MAG: AraC family transcriptional regulator [Verrucomicrobiota bacterium]TAF27987.1 MAG: AraC family transcriptional regulator [Verrucomicrobiota bacterium]TAF42834.1 MAG: AraC family transcriptional regulator [Verrucomicrobiota bacterium]
MRLIDTTDARANAGMRTIVSNSKAERESLLAGKFRIQLLGMYFSEVGPEWSSEGKLQADYLNHIDITLSGRRQVVAGGRVYDLEPGQVWFLPGNTPVERRCEEPCEVLFFKFSSEWLPGVDPLLDWPARGPRMAGVVEPDEWREWLDEDRARSVANLLLLRGRLLSWFATAVPELDEVISGHLETHTQFTPVFQLIEQNLGARLRLGDLAKVYGTTAEAFSMAFVRSTGITPKAYLTRRLNQEALRWVINTDLKMKEIADRLGFSDEYYFSRFFQKLNGSAPSRYRREFRGR